MVIIPDNFSKLMLPPWFIINVSNKKDMINLPVITKETKLVEPILGMVIMRLTTKNSPQIPPV